MENLKSVLAKVVVKEISALELSENRISNVKTSPLLVPFLSFCLENDVVSREKLEFVVHTRLRRFGRQMFERHQETEEYPDHLPSPHALAYAIAENVLRPEEVSRIKFDHGDNAATFMRGSAEMLLSEVMQQLCPTKVAA